MVGDKNKLQNNVHGLIPYDKTKMKVFLSICGRGKKERCVLKELMEWKKQHVSRPDVEEDMLSLG